MNDFIFKTVARWASNNKVECVNVTVCSSIFNNKAQYRVTLIENIFYDEDGILINKNENISIDDKKYSHYFEYAGKKYYIQIDE